MTKQDFIKYLSQPESLNNASISDLEKLVQQFPYFQLGRMLYLKNLHNENSIAYEKNLHITTAYAPNGKVLYNLIKKRALKEEVGNKQLAVSKEQPVQIEILPKLEPIVILQEMNMTSGPNVSTTLDTPKDHDLEILEKEMLREAYRVSMTVDVLQEQGTKDASTSLSTNKGQVTKGEAAVKPETSNLKPSTAVYSFGDWMKVITGKTPDSVVEEKAIQKKQKNQIMESFILEETAKATPKPKAEFYSVENRAKKSIQDDETFVSETLAKIYLKQGNLPKALRAYEILLVKHPEKVHIFAPLLEKIKKLLEDQKAK